MQDKPEVQAESNLILDLAKKHGIGNAVGEDEDGNPADGEEEDAGDNNSGGDEDDDKSEQDKKSEEIVPSSKTQERSQELERDPKEVAEELA